METRGEILSSQPVRGKQMAPHKCLAKTLQPPSVDDIFRYLLLMVVTVNTLFAFSHLKYVVL